jgi:hypothetical protein
MITGRLSHFRAPQQRLARHLSHLSGASCHLEASLISGTIHEMQAVRLVGRSRAAPGIDESHRPIQEEGHSRDNDANHSPFCDPKQECQRIEDPRQVVVKYQNTGNQ